MARISKHAVHALKIHIVERIEQAFEQLIIQLCMVNEHAHRKTYEDMGAS